MKYRLYYWGIGLEQWIKFFSTDSIEVLEARLKEEKEKHPHLTLKATEEKEINC